MSVIRILLADDHALVRQSLRALLKKAQGIEVVGEAQDGYDAIQRVEALQPDLVIMDVSMPYLDGISATQRIMESDNHSQVLIVSMYGHDSLVRQALRSGARGYLLKQTISEELLPAIHQITNGMIVVSPALENSLRTDS